MGPLRRGLILGLLTPNAALAEVCDKVRPFVSPGEPGTAFTEMVSLMGTPPSLILLVLSALAIRFRWQWAALGIVVLWSIWVSLVAMQPPDGTLLLAIEEGCVGPPTLFIALVAAICGGMMLYTAPRKAKTDGNTDGEA